MYEMVLCGNDLPQLPQTCQTLTTQPSPDDAACALPSTHISTCVSFLIDCFLHTVARPFKVDGAHTSDSNAQFDAQLRASDPAWGYRDQADVVHAAEAQGLQLAAVVPMPANNFIMLFVKKS